MKLLSIIVPLYNSAKFLPKCLDSLLAQDISPEEYEIILVDDGSPDNSRQVAEEYASRHSNIIVLSQPNKGTSGARNTGLRQAVGKYVYFVDPDDYILENSLFDILHLMEEEELDILRFGYIEVNEDYQPTKSCKNPDNPDLSSGIMDGPTFLAERLGIACYVWTYLFRTALIKDNGIFFIEGDYFDDTPWLPRVCMKAKRVDSVNVKRHFYLIRQDSLVQSVTANSVHKKIRGQLFLIDELCRQERVTDNLSASKWYRMMLAHCVITVLTLVGCYEYDQHQDYINRLKQSRVFPLSTVSSTQRTRYKARVVNLSPQLFCFLIHKRSEASII